MFDFDGSPVTGVNRVLRGSGRMTRQPVFSPVLGIPRICGRRRPRVGDGLATSNRNSRVIVKSDHLPQRLTGSCF
jgi:hypothetical protein